MLFGSSNAKKLLLGFGFLGAFSSLNALEFGSMGNTSAAMGGAGVALKHSAWGLYYNPALLSSDPKVKLGYSLGVGLEENNISKLATIDVANMTDTADRLVGMLSGGGMSSGVVTDVIEEALSSVLGNSATGDIEKDLENYIKNNNGNYGDLINGIFDAIKNNSTISQDQKDLFDNIVNNIDYGNLDFSAGGLIENITINKGGDYGLDKTVETIDLVQDILKSNNLNFSSQNGVILQISSKTMNERLGSLGVAFFASAYSNMSINADSSRLRLIVDGGNGSYYELVDNGNSFSFKASTQSDYNKYSIIASLASGSDAHKLVATSFVLSEVPVGYARTFYLKNGNLNIGVTGKLMHAISMQHAITLNADTDFAKELTNFASLDNAISSKSFGIDIGALYELDLPEFRYLTLGLVAKNINSPTFKSTIQDIVAKPQYRFGIGYNSGFLTAAFDADIVPNDILALSGAKSQMIGGGVGFNLKALDVRLGMMKDLRQETGLILTGGLNVLGFLDVALQTSTDFTKINNYPIPQYFNLRIGGSLSF